MGWVSSDWLTVQARNPRLCRWGCQSSPSWVRPCTCSVTSPSLRDTTTSTVSRWAEDPPPLPPLKMITLHCSGSWTRRRSTDLCPGPGGSSRGWSSTPPTSRSTWRAPRWSESGNTCWCCRLSAGTRVESTNARWRWTPRPSSSSSPPPTSPSWSYQSDTPSYQAWSRQSISRATRSPSTAPPATATRPPGSPGCWTTRRWTGGWSPPTSPPRTGPAWRAPPSPSTSSSCPSTSGVPSRSSGPPARRTCLSSTGWRFPWSELSSWAPPRAGCDITRGAGQPPAAPKLGSTSSQAWAPAWRGSLW